MYNLTASKQENSCIGLEERKDQNKGSRLLLDAFQFVGIG
jgi:hypothetical protein